jgi:thymidylate synthase
MEKKNNLDPQYNNLLKDILENGIKKQTRNGEVISVFGRQIRHNMSDGFPLLTGKKMFFKGMVTELLWFLRGDTNIKFLVDNDCHIWDGDCYQAYLKSRNKTQQEYKEKWGDEISNNPLTQEEFINKIKTDDEFAKKWGDLGPVYGKQWRRWTKKKMYLSTDGSYENIYDEADQTVIDQISCLINELKTNPDSRRLMVNAWNVGELDQCVLPPCHYSWQVYTKELSLDERLDLMRKRTRDGTVDYDNRHHAFLDYHDIPKRAISLMWNQRSVDTFLGLPFNIASYGLLLEIIAKEVNMVPDELIGNLGDVHLYTNHVEQAKEQIGRTSFELPTLKFNPIFLANLEHKGFDDAINGQINFELENYQSHPTIKAPLSN